MKKGNASGTARRVPTLPNLREDEDTSSLYSSNTGSSLPPYSAGPTRTSTSSTNASRTAAMKPSLPSLVERPALNRSDTSFTTTSYATDAPLLSQAGSMGMASSNSLMHPRDMENDYFNQAPRDWPMAHGPPGRTYSPMSQGRDSHPPRAFPPRINTSSSNGRVSPPSQLVSPLRNGSRGVQENAYDDQGPSYGDMAFSPYENRAPVSGPAYEMSPVDVSPLEYTTQDYRFGPSGPHSFKPPHLPNALRSGSPADPHGMNSSFTSPPSSRSGTAPPNNPRTGLPAALQSAIQRREASQPLPNRGTNMMQQQRSATAPLRHPAWGQGPSQRSNSAAPGGGYTRY